MDLTQYIILGRVLGPKLTCKSHSPKDQVTPQVSESRSSWKKSTKPHGKVRWSMSFAHTRLIYMCLGAEWLAPSGKLPDGGLDQIPSLSIFKIFNKILFKFRQNGVIGLSGEFQDYQVLVRKRCILYNYIIDSLALHKRVLKGVLQKKF